VLRRRQFHDQRTKSKPIPPEGGSMEVKMKKIKITQVKSTIDRPERQKKTMEALGLRKLNNSVEVEATPQILGMVRKVNHLVKVEELAN
jgi:large subunit ribosomal protein L30